MAIVPPTPYTGPHTVIASEAKQSSPGAAQSARTTEGGRPYKARLAPINKEAPRLGCFFCVYSYFAFFSLIAAWAAARRAMGTRNGEQDT